MFRLRTLGLVDLRTADGEEMRGVLAQPKRVGLLVYLALATPRGPQRRDRLMALFWPEQDAEHARNALNQAVFFLRRHLGADAIVARNGEEIALNADMIWCDAFAFEEAHTAGRNAEAIELYRGELLASFHVPEAAAELERWIDAERHRLATQYAAALARLATEREAAKDFGGAVVWWRRLAAQDPHNGRVTLSLMHALAAAGDRAAALDHARVHTMLLQEELGLEPDADVTAYVKRLRDPSSAIQESSPPVASPRPTASALPPNDAPPSARAPSFWRRRLIPIVAVGALAVIAALTIVYRARASHPDPIIDSIAVLPFENLTGDPSKEYMADVMTDAVITDVSRYKALRVISRTSVTQYKGAKRPVGEIAKDLGVDGIVEGTLTRDGRSIQVTAQLIYAPNDRHLWADRFIRDSANVLAVVGDISTAIAHEVRLLTGPGAPEPRPRLTTNADAYALYLRGQSAMLSRTPRAVNDARAFFRQSLVLDSTFALGYAGLADLFIISGADGYMPLRFARDSARLFAARSLALDSTLSEGHTALAYALAEQTDWDAAEREYRRAIELGPSNALARHWYAHYLAVRGRLDSARTQINIGRQIDPVSASLRSTANAIENALGVARPSSQRAAQIVLRDPLHAWTRASYADRLSQEGKCAEARAQIDTAKDMVPNNIRMLTSVFAVEWRCGDRAKARAMFEQLKRRPDAHAKGLWIARTYNAWGQRDSAFVWLDSIEWNGDMRFNFLVGQAWNGVRKDPRYPRILRQMGLAH